MLRPADLATRLRAAEQPRILLIALRRLGDVLLTTPLLHSLRESVPHAQIDALVFRGSEGILAGNPDISNVRTIPEKTGIGETLRLLASLWRRYDLAVSTQTGDKPTLYAWIAGRKRAGILRHDSGFWLKRRMLQHCVMGDLSVHRVVEGMRLLDQLGLATTPRLVPPQGAALPEIAPKQPYAVLHPNPKYPYKRWNRQGWRDLAAGLAARGLAVAVTGGPDPAERCYLDTLWDGISPAPHRLDGRLDWPQIAALIGGAAVYVGTDTSLTHLAAATGRPTVAIYGPVDPRIMGPWPVGGLEPPWAAAGTIQHRANVWLVQNPLPCLPCEKLGCDGRLDSRAQCLDELRADQVLAAVDAALTPAPSMR
jgi:heptosyltransferase-3